MEQGTSPIMRKLACFVGFEAILAWSSIASAQSLADVAWAEEARRKAVKTPAKVCTNDDLKRAGDSTPSPAPPKPVAPGAAPASPVAPEQPAAGADTSKDGIQKQTKAIADIEEEARKAAVPAGWLR